MYIIRITVTKSAFIYTLEDNAENVRFYIVFVINIQLFS